MNFVEVEVSSDIATVFLSRGKVNALNALVVDELKACLSALEGDRDLKALILTGRGKFFSFGFDIPEFLGLTQEAFTDFVTNFTELYTRLFLYPKPVVAALNGHAIAGGCMLALACDNRVMAAGKSKIALNEIAFGSTVFAGSTEMLRFLVGNANATEILYSGALYSAEEAMRLGLVQAVIPEEDLMVAARRIATNLASKPAAAWASIKALLRKPIAEAMMQRERKSIRELVDIWYSEPTWAKLQDIKIR